MPWRGAEFPGEVPSLGDAIGRWVEGHCVVPDGDHAGEPYKLTEEMWDFLLHHYRVKPDAVGDRLGFDPLSRARMRRDQSSTGLNALGIVEQLQRAGAALVPPHLGTQLEPPADGDPVPDE